MLSPQDLSALPLVPGLIRAGVSSLKIEGRLKGPEYVALATRMYREAVDKAWDDIQREAEGGPAAGDNGGGESLRRKQMALGQLFARAQDEDNDGLSSGFLEGTNHQKVVIGRSPRHRGVFAGTVASVSKRSSSVLIDMPRDESKRVTIKTGDGLVFDGGRPESEEAGGRWCGPSRERTKSKWISESAPQTSQVQPFPSFFRSFFPHCADCVNLSSLLPAAICVGDLVWRNKDPALEREIRKSQGKMLDTRRNTLRLPVEVTANGSIGEPLQLTIRLTGQDRRVTQVTESSALPLEPAKKMPLTEKSVAKAVGQLGGTMFALASGLDFRVAEAAFLPVNEIKDTRRRAVARLEEMLATPVKDQGPISDSAEVSRDCAESGHWDESEGPSVAPQLSVMCRLPGQVDPLLALPHDMVPEIILDFLSMEGLREATR